MISVVSPSNPLSTRACKTPAAARLRVVINISTEIPGPVEEEREKSGRMNSTGFVFQLSRRNVMLPAATDNDKWIGVVAAVSLTSRRWRVCEEVTLRIIGWKVSEDEGGGGGGNSSSSLADVGTLYD